MSKMIYGWPTALTTVAVIIIIAALTRISSSTETCIGKFCFTTPESNGLRNFDGARSWCSDINSALYVVGDSEAQRAFYQFLTSSNISAMMFINVKRYQHDNAWFLVNGSSYNGIVGNQGNADYQLYAYLKLYGDRYQVDALRPNESNRYICEFQDAKCSNTAVNNIVYNGRCYIKYEDETLTWFQAREKCFNNGGDLATFQSNPRNAYLPQLNTAWLNESFSYWVGIRYSDLRWNSPDGGKETIYTSWSIGKPNNYNYQCVCVDPKATPAWSWTDCNCSETRQFVCLRTNPSSTTTTSKVPSGDMSGCPSNNSEVLLVGLVLGIGAILPLLITILVLVIAIVYLRRQLREKPRKRNEVVNHYGNNNFTMASRSSTEPETSDTHYQNLRNNARPETMMPVYDRLSHPETGVYDPIA